jgi:hypothetical protein
MSGLSDGSVEKRLWRICACICIVYIVQVHLSGGVAANLIYLPTAYQYLSHLPRWCLTNYIERDRGRRGFDIDFKSGKIGSRV